MSCGAGRRWKGKKKDGSEEEAVQDAQFIKSSAEERERRLVCQEKVPFNKGKKRRALQAASGERARKKLNKKGKEKVRLATIKEAEWKV